MIQGVLVFACMRASDEIAFCEVDEFTELDDTTISFQMRRDFKSMKLDAHMNVTRKPARVIVGHRYVQILRLLKEKRTPGGKHNNILWSKP